MDVEYKIEEQSDGKCLAIGKLTQSGVSKEFAMPVPLYAEFDGQLARLGTIRIIGESTVDNIKIMLPKKPTHSPRRRTQEFVQTYVNGNATTEDFKIVAEKHITPNMNLTGDGKLNWFFNEWVYGTQLPLYKFDYKLEEQAGGKCLAIGTLTQSGVTKNCVGSA